LIQGVSPVRVGLIAVLAVFLASLLRASSRRSPRAWIAALERGARAALPVTIAFDLLVALAAVVAGRSARPRLRQLALSASIPPCPRSAPCHRN
jgi:TRAP-type uncharacterized transport system fused permease subunit